MGKCRRTGLINDDYLPLFLASLDVRPFKVLGCSELTLTLNVAPAPAFWLRKKRQRR